MAITKRAHGRRPLTIDLRAARGIEGGATFTRETHAAKKTKRCPRCLAVSLLVFRCWSADCPRSFAILDFMRRIDA